MQFFWFIIKLIALTIIQSLLTPRRDAPSAGEVTLPTVSQARKIPLVLGREKVTGPNVMEGTEFKTKAIRKKSGLFKKTTVGYNYFQNIEFGIAYGPCELYEVYGGDYTIYDAADLATNTTVEIDEPTLYGPSGEPGSGGVRGTMRFIPGDGNGYINTQMETDTGRNQPGCPYLARVHMYASNRGFWWGNSPRYRALAFEVGHYADPQLMSPSLHKIGDEMNPAYALFALNRDEAYGLDIRGTVRASDITDMATTLYSEGLGYSRTFYEGDASAVEAEILDYIEGVRFRDASTGELRYKLIREGADASPLPTLGDDEIIEFKIGGSTLSAVGTEVSVSYIDRDAGYKEVAITESNAAAYHTLGRHVLVTRSFPGCKSGTIARRIAAREAIKLTKPMREGTIVVDRTAWDWNIGDSFVLSYSPAGLVSLVVRIVEIDKGTLTDGRISISFMEDVFSYGTAVFDTQVTSISAPQSAVTAITDQQLIELPVYLIGDDPDNQVELFAEDASNSSAFYYQLNTGGAYSDIGEGDFADSYALTASQDAEASTSSMTVSGDIFTHDTVTEDEILGGLRNIGFVVAPDGSHEVIGWESSSHTGGVTTLTNVSRGLVDTFPRPFTTSDKLYILGDGYRPEFTFADSDSFNYRFLPFNSLGTLAEGSATVESHTIVNRYDAPLLPGYIRMNSTQFPASVTGDLTVTWAHRDRGEQANATLAWDNTSNQGPEASVTYTVTTWDTSGSPWVQLDQQTGLTGTTYSYAPSPIPTISARVTVKAVRSGTDSFQEFYHDFNWSA